MSFINGTAAGYQGAQAGLLPNVFDEATQLLDPSDPVFHGTGSTNTVLGTTTIGPGMVVTPSNGKLTIGGYVTQTDPPTLPPDQLIPTTNQGTASMVCGMNCRTLGGAFSGMNVGLGNVIGNATGDVHSVASVAGVGNQAVMDAGGSIDNGLIFGHLCGITGTGTSTGDHLFGSFQGVVSNASSQNTLMVGSSNSAIFNVAADRNLVVGNNNTIADCNNTITLGFSTGATSTGSVIVANSGSSTTDNAIVLGTLPGGGNVTADADNAFSIGVGGTLPLGGAAPSAGLTDRLRIRINGTDYCLGLYAYE